MFSFRITRFGLAEKTRELTAEYSSTSSVRTNTPQNRLLAMLPLKGNTLNMEPKIRSKHHTIQKVFGAFQIRIFISWLWENVKMELQSEE